MKHHFKYLWIMGATAALAACGSGDRGSAMGSAELPLTAEAETSDGTLSCDGMTSVEVRLTADNVTSVTPTDVMFVLDDSGSISPASFDAMRSALINLVSGLDVVFDNGGQIGVVLFNGQSVPHPNGQPYVGTSRLEQPLSASETDVVDALSAMSHLAGTTCTSCGMDTAIAEFQADSHPSHNRVMIVLTDGASNATAEPRPPGQTPGQWLQTVLQASVDGAEAEGIETYALGIGGNLNPTELALIATDPDASHLFLSADYGALATSLDSIAAAVVSPEATNALLTLEVDPAFLPSSPLADAGQVTLVDNTLEWSLTALQDETVTLTYDITHVPASPGGATPVHDSVSYTDDQGNVLDVPSLEVIVYGCDGDGDGVVDEEDACADTASGDVVDASGCSIAQYCPCDGDYRNHGEYAGCVARTATAFAHDGLVTHSERAEIVSGAGDSDCGK
jgi:hypothetical protein